MNSKNYFVNFITAMIAKSVEDASKIEPSETGELWFCTKRECSEPKFSNQDRVFIEWKWRGTFIRIDTSEYVVVEAQGILSYANGGRAIASSYKII